MNPHTSQTRSRIIADVILLFSVLYAPWWFVASALFLGVCYFKNFHEAFFFGLLFDTFYGVNVASLHGFRFVFSSASLLMIFMAEFVKGKIRL